MSFKRTLLLPLIVIVIAILAVHHLNQEKIYENKTIKSVTATTSRSFTTESVLKTTVNISVVDMKIDIYVNCEKWIVEEVFVYNSILPLEVAEAQVKSIESSLMSNLRSYGGSLLSFSYNISNNKIIVKYSVKGFTWRSNHECYADTSWIIRPLGLDLIDDRFKETKTSLSWSGTINGIKLSVTINLPPQNITYAAWQEKVGHCHAHIWWPAKG